MLHDYLFHRSIASADDVESFAGGREPATVWGVVRFLAFASMRWAVYARCA